MKIARWRNLGNGIEQFEMVSHWDLEREMQDDETLRLQLRRERAETDAAYRRARIQERICPCGRQWEEGARFCDLCGAPVGYTGKTERLR